MRAPSQSHTTRIHQPPAWLQIGMTVIGGVALGLLILQVLVSRDHGFIGPHDAQFQAPTAPHQPTTH